MPTLHTDVAIIGAGTAGMTAYRAARNESKNVLLIESHVYGTTCARVGCMPSKLLIAAAEAAHAAQTASAFGVHAAPLRIDGKAVMARVRSERDRFVGFVVSDVEAFPAETKLMGRAVFTGPNTLQVGDTEVQAKAIVIASGSTPKVADEWRIAGDRIITSDDVFDWTDLPESVAVVGTGVIGLELGQALHRLGVRVALFARGDSVAQISDPTLLEVADRALSEELDIRF
jgi:dihydrolipoamide dehydrogenase